VTVRPYYSPNPDGPNYEQYYRQRLMLRITFRHMSDLLGENESYAAAYRQMLQSANLPPSLEEDVHRLEQFELQLSTEDNTAHSDTEVCTANYVKIVLTHNFYVASSDKSTTS